MKKIVSILTIILLFAGTAASQQRDFAKEFERFRQQANKRYDDFRQQANAEYARFMRNVWKLYQGEKPEPAPVIPDQHVTPVVAPDVKPETRPVVVDTVLDRPVVAPAPPKPVAPVEEVDEPETARFEFGFFGAQCTVRLNGAQRFHLADTRETSVADEWEKLSGREYNNLILDCLNLRDSLNLCDWAYLLLTDTLSRRFFAASPDDAVLLHTFLMSQSGYKIRLARSPKGRLFMLYASDYSIFGHSYYTLGGEKFYLETEPDDGDNRLHIFAQGFKGEQTLSVIIAREQRFPFAESSPRRLEAKRYSVASATVSPNRNLIDFLAVYPQSGVNKDFTSKWKFYANTPLSAQVREPLYAALHDAVGGKNKIEAVGILLNFVQTAFTYGFDDEVWGGDRPFFPEETVYYPYSDCEDRAILFSRLVRDLTGLKVVLLYYPTHLATAVKFDEEVAGDYIVVHGDRYTVCDPTYVNACVGVTMTGMDNSAVKVLMLEN